MAGFVTSMRACQAAADTEPDPQTAKDSVRAFLDSADWCRAYARMVIDRCIDAIGGCEAASVSEDAIEAVLAANKASFTLWTKFFRKLFLDGAKPDKQRRPNLIWDCQILSSAEGLRIDDRPITLVTTDREMLNAATKVGKGENCLNFADYRALLSAAAEQTDPLDKE